MPISIPIISNGNWDQVNENLSTIARFIRQPMPQARVTHSVSQSIPNATFTTLAFNSERYNNGAMHDVATNNSRLTAKVTGLYSIGAAIWFDTNVAGIREVRINLNGATPIVIARAHVQPDGYAEAILTTEYRLAAGDYVQVLVFQSSGGALSVTSGAEYSPLFWAHRISGYTNEGLA
jgi:hypothetical protein